MTREIHDKVGEITALDPDVFIACETFITEETRCDYARLFVDYDIKIVNAIVTGGRPARGFLLGRKNGIVENVQIVNMNSYGVILEVRQGRETIHVILAYVPPDKDHDGKMYEILDEIGKFDNVILMGDLNARIGEYSADAVRCTLKALVETRETKDKTTNRRGEKLIQRISNDQLMVVNGRTIGDQRGDLTYIGHNGGSVIDLALANQRGQKFVQNLEIKPTHLSDHMMIMLSLGSQAGSRRKNKTPCTKLHWNKEAVEEFSAALERITEASKLNFDEFSDMIWKAAEESGMKCKGYHVQGQTGAAWFTQECRMLKKEVQKRLQAIRRSEGSGVDPDFPELIADYRIERSKYRKMKNDCRKKYYQDLIEIINNSKNSADFWKAINIFRGTTNALVKNSITAEQWVRHYKKVFTAEQVVTEENMEQELTENENENLDKDFTMEELEGSIKKLGKNKAPGEDGIPNEVWKALGPTAKQVLLDIMNSCLNEKIPETWATTVTVPIFKKGCKENPKNYRPISLLNTVTKLFTCLLANRIQQLTEEEGIIHDNQAAYRKGRGCEDHVFTLNAIIQRQLNKKMNTWGKGKSQAKYGKLYACFIDLAGAFDSCNHDLLWKRLDEEGLSSKIIMKIRELYGNAKTRIRANGKLTEDVQILKGVLQGETLSPTLFNLFLNKIVTELEDEGQNGVGWGEGQVALLLYADDQVLISSHPLGLQKLINKIASLFKSMNLKVNLTKTKIVVFRRGGKLEKKLKFTWEEETVEIVNEYIYLGVKFSSSGKFTKARQVFSQKANIAIQNLQSLIWKSKTKDVRVAHKLFTSLVTSVLFYGAPVWGLQYIELFEKFQTNFLRWFYALSNATPAYFMRLETGIDNITCNYFRLVLKFLYRILTSKSKLIQQSVDQSKKTQHEDVKYSWWKQLEVLLKHGGIEEDVNMLTAEYIRENYKSLLARFSQNMLMKDIEDMKKDYRFQKYKEIKLKVGPSDYIECEMNQDVKKFLINLRAMFPRIYVRGKVVNLNAVWKTWGRSRGNNNSTDCQLCNLREIEDISHVMLRCPQYKNLRKTCLREIAEGGTGENDNGENNDYCSEIIYSKVQETWEKMYNFWINAIRLRGTYLNLMEEDM